MIAICCRLRKPLNFDVWIDYHLSLGVDYFFLVIEDTPELLELTTKYENIYVFFQEGCSKKNNYFGLMNRQKELFTHHLPQIKKIGIEWIFHIDCDELICSSKNLKDLLDRVPKDRDVVKMQNYEAVYDRDDLEIPFYQTNTFKYRNRLSYSNGKSAVRVDDIKLLDWDSPIGRCFSPHSFGGKSIDVPPAELVILHFDSATFRNWYEKFKNLIDIEPQFFSEIPFVFYRESIEIIKSGDLILAREFYNKMKVGLKDSVVKLYWTPQLENKNVNWSGY